MSTPPRVLAICADDVGLVEGVAETVVALAAERRLSAASCVTNAPGWRAAAAVVTRSPAPLALGLHFNLSEGVPLSAELRDHWPTLPGLGRLLALASLRLLPRAAIAVEFSAQVGAFIGAVGVAPAFVDGHQHVHALPVVRDIVVDAIGTWPEPSAVRSTARLPGPGAGLKRRVIEASGGRALQRALRRRGLAHNRVLLGAYDFHDVDYRRLMRAWLAQAPAEGGLLFCHPGAGASDPGDAIAAARRREAAYLGSDDFAADLAAAGVTVAAAAPKRSSSGD